MRAEVAQLSLADGTGESYQYDGAGNQTGRTNGLGQRTAYAYDASNNLASIAYPSGPGVSYAYDLDGRTASMTDATGTSTWTYDLGDRTTSLATPQGTQSYSYDGWGRRTLLDLGNGSTIATVYSNERLASVTKMPENETTSWGYGADDVLRTQTLPSGAVTRYGYDNLDRVSSIAHQAPGGGAITTETYQYDAGGNLTYKVVDGARTDYGYDAIDQLTSEAGPYGTTQYTYDGNGNRLTRAANGLTESYVYDDGDKLTRRSGGPQGTVAYGYDANGRTRTVQTGSGTTTLTYDYEDRLTGVTGPGGLSATYAYNGADARVSKSGTGGARTYRRDGVGVTDPVLSDGVATMVPSISERSGGSTRFQHLDRLGSKTKVTDATGSVVGSAGYDAFGHQAQYGNVPGSQAGFAAGYGYQEDGETNLKLLGHRDYDPATGRFLTRDPIGSGTNWYRYADNNPLKSVDPDGLKRIPVVKGDAYSVQIEASIAQMRLNGENQAADSLQKALIDGRVFVEDDPAGLYVQTKSGRVKADAVVNDKSQEMTIAAAALNNEIHAEAVLFHESVHLREAAAKLPGQERMATTVAEAYCRRRAADPKVKRRGDDAQWDSYAYTNVQERARFAPYEGDAVARYLDIVFHRLFPGG